MPCGLEGFGKLSPRKLSVLWCRCSSTSESCAGRRYLWRWWGNKCSCQGIGLSQNEVPMLLAGKKEVMVMLGCVHLITLWVGSCLFWTGLSMYSRGRGKAIDSVRAGESEIFNPLNLWKKSEVIGYLCTGIIGEEALETRKCNNVNPSWKQKPTRWLRCEARVWVRAPQRIYHRLMLGKLRLCAQGAMLSQSSNEAVLVGLQFLGFAQMGAWMTVVVGVLQEVRTTASSLQDSSAFVHKALQPLLYSSGRNWWFLGRDWDLWTWPCPCWLECGNRRCRHNYSHIFSGPCSLSLYEVMCFFTLFQEIWGIGQLSKQGRLLVYLSFLSSLSSLWDT